MKNLLLLLSIMFTLSVTAQQSNNINEVKVYGSTNGIQNVIPSQILETKANNTVEVYNVNNGIKAVTPSYIYSAPVNNEFKIYTVTNGITNPIPITVVVTK
jgi:hypothetical protein